MAKDRFSLVEIGKTVDKLKQQNTELLKQNKALVECLKKLCNSDDLGIEDWIEANELLNTLK